MISGTIQRAQVVANVKYLATEGEPSLPPGRDVCQITLTSGDDAMYHRVVLEVLKVFAVLVDADVILKGQWSQWLGADNHFLCGYWVVVVYN